MTIYLYVKTHNITGLKYLGKTIRDPKKYHGSGVRWLNHLKIHGNNVSTSIIGTYETLDRFREAGLFYSKLWNIVESDEWANLTEEDGYGSSGWNLTPEQRTANGKKSKELQLGLFDPKNKQKIDENRIKTWTGRKHSEETKNLMREKAKNRQLKLRTEHESNNEIRC